MLRAHALSPQTISLFRTAMDKPAEEFDWQNAMDMLAEAMDTPTLSTDQTID